MNSPNKKLNFWKNCPRNLVVTVSLFVVGIVSALGVSLSGPEPSVTSPTNPPAPATMSWDEVTAIGTAAAAFFAAVATWQTKRTSELHVAVSRAVNLSFWIRFAHTGRERIFYGIHDVFDKFLWVSSRFYPIVARSL